MRSRSFSSISKHSGAAMSSRLMPPNVGSSAATMSTELVDVVLVDLEVEHVDVGELLEQAGLALHHRLAGQRADVAQAEHRRAVGDDRDQVAARGVLPRAVLVACDLQARLGDAGRVGEREVELADQRLGRNDLELSLASTAVVFERVFLSPHAAHGRPVAHGWQIKRGGLGPPIGGHRTSSPSSCDSVGAAPGVVETICRRSSRLETLSRRAVERHLGSADLRGSSRARPGCLRRTRGERRRAVRRRAGVERRARARHRRPGGGR